MKKSFLQVGELSIFVTESGMGPGAPTLIFVHGNSSSSRFFSPQLESQLASKFRLIALDLPGHGQSSRSRNPAETYHLPGYARVLTEVARQLNAMNAVLVGFSLGGHVVLEALGEFPEAPGFMIVGAPPLDFPPAMDLAFTALPAFSVAFSAESPEPLVDEYLAALVRPGAQLPSFYKEDFLKTDGRARSGLAASIAPGGYKDEIKVVGQMKNPLAVVYGEFDQISNRSYAEKLSIPTLWRGVVQVMPEVGHCVHWEDPKGFNGLLEAFVHDCLP